LESFFEASSHFLYTYAKALLCGVYSKKASTEWKICYQFPSRDLFEQFFKLREPLFELLEKVSSDDASHFIFEPFAETYMCYIFVPLPTHDKTKDLVIYLFGFGVRNKGDAELFLQFTDELRKPLIHWLKFVISKQQNVILEKKVKERQNLHAELEMAAKWNRALIGVLSRLDSAEYGSHYLVVCTDVKGTIMYISPRIQDVLGYTAFELVGLRSVLILHDSNEIYIRAREIEIDTGKAVPPGFAVLSQYAVDGKKDRRVWNWKTKHGNSLLVNVDMRALHDEYSIFGFVEVVSLLKDGLV